MLKIPNNEIKLDRKPTIACIILTKDNTEKLFKCLDSIINEGYPNLKIVIGDTGSNFTSRQEIKKFFSSYKKITHKSNLVTYKKDNLEIVWENGLDYNFSKNNNYLVNAHTSDNDELILFSNNDIELVNNCIHQMAVAFTLEPYRVGTVGCQLIFDNQTIQHKGILAVENHDGSKLGLRYTFGHIDMGTMKYGDKPEWVFGNTGAFLMIKRDIFNSVGGFSEDYISVFQDVQLNLDCLRMGMRNLCVNSAVAYHYESSTRKTDPKDHIKLRTDLIKFNEKVKGSEYLLDPYIERAYLKV